jgi:DNA-binding transcriptional ArsR family regulator
MHRYQLDSTTIALGDPTRRAMLQRLAHGPATAGQLGAPFSISQPATSRHLRVLRDAGLVETTSSGRNLWYELRPGPLLDLKDWLTALAMTWAEAPRLDITQPVGPRR